MSTLLYRAHYNTRLLSSQSAFAKAALPPPAKHEGFPAPLDSRRGTCYNRKTIERLEGTCVSSKTFIWDLDGTLLDSYGVIVSSLLRTLEELNVPMEEEEIRRRATAGSVSDVVNYAAAATGRTFSDIKARYSEISGGRYLEITTTPHAREALEETA